MLLKRLYRTTNEQEGGIEFVSDLRHILFDVQQVLTAGLSGIHDVSFPHSATTNAVLLL